MNAHLPTQLAARLTRPLPGWPAQSRFQPELSFGRHAGPAPARARPAAVLVLLYPLADHWHIPLILRPAHMLDHASQVSLPGGVIEAGESSAQAAVREFSEELGAAVDGVQLLGKLTPLYLFASDFHVTPWVGWLGEPAIWQPNPHEVDRVLEVPLSHFCDPAVCGTLERRQGGVEYLAPCFHWQAERIWGATSMILAELVAILSELDL
ncbi:MAG TPA: CoA pyrophosphatase [Pirellulales bacterium]|nr:CoA pyrophosphatase [Pirellulales bacterium]